MRRSIDPKTAYHLINHGPCNLITTGKGDRRNVAPINWTLPLNDDPPLLLTVIEEGIYTDELLKESRAFTVNIVGEEQAEALLGCGKTHGKEVDKFAKFHLTPLAGKKTASPYLKESIGHIECRLKNQHPYDGVTIYVGEVVYAEVEEEFWDGKSIIPGKAKTLHHLTGGRFAVAERVIEVKKPA